VFTYALTLTPQVNGVKGFNTGFAVGGFDPDRHKAGYGFAQALAAGASAGETIN